MIKVRPTKFFFDELNNEPHAARKQEILAKHPEIAKLMGPEPLTKYIVFVTVLIQLYASIWIQDKSWPVFIFTAYVVGATITQSLFLAIHELSHKLGSKCPQRNRIYALIANLPIMLPYSMSFTPFHMEHHRFQGHEGVDTDIPTSVECKISDILIPYFPHCILKALFLFFQLAFYAIRPLIVSPNTLVKENQRHNWITYGNIFQYTFDIIFIYNFGFYSCFYLLLSTFLAGSLHPTAGHFIAEHYIFDDPNYETYSYYGILNYVTYNVGYHNEHHDFPNIPWSRLPLVRKMAPEYYDNLPQVTSWVGVLFRFIFDDNITPFNRLKRPHKVYDK